MVQVLTLWALVRVLILFIASPGPDFIDVVRVRKIIISMAGPDSGSGPGFIHLESGFYSVPELFPIFESESGSASYQASPGPCPGPDFIHLKSVSGVYQALPGLGLTSVRLLVKSS